MVPTCFGLRPSSGSLQFSLAKVILTLRHSVRSFGGVAACPSVKCVLYAVQSETMTRSAQHTVHSTQFTLGHPATPPNDITECLNVNIILARLSCKLPDDGRRPKHVGAI